MKKGDVNQVIKLAELFEKKIKLAQENDFLKDLEKFVQAPPSAPQQPQSIDDQISALKFDRFDGTDASLLETAYALLSPADRRRLTNYVDQKYPAKDDEDRSVQLLSDPTVMAIVKPIMDKIKKKWDEWKQTHIDADKEAEQFAAKKQEDENIAAQRNKNRRPLTDQDLQILNFKTTRQTEINRTVKLLAGPQVKGQITVKLVISPDLTLDYTVDFSGTGMDNTLKYKITNGLHQYDSVIKAELSNKMYTQNKYIEKPLVTILWQGTL